MSGAHWIWCNTMYILRIQCRLRKVLVLYEEFKTIKITSNQRQSKWKTEKWEFYKRSSRARPVKDVLRGVCGQQTEGHLVRRKKDENKVC